MNMQIRKIINELGFKRTKEVFFHKTEEYWYISSNVFVLKIHKDDYDKIHDNDKEKLDKILEEKATEKPIKVYKAMFDSNEKATFTGFLTMVKNKLLAIYDIGEDYVFLDQAVTLDIEPSKFTKVTKETILIAQLSEKTEFAAVKLISQEVTNRINSDKYFKSKE